MPTMKKLGTLLWIATLLTLSPTGAPAAGTPWKQPYDSLQWGKSGSTANKSLVFDFGLGASNPSLFSDNATKSLNYNKDGILLGDGTSSTKTITANLGLGSTNPKLNYDPAASSWQFSNDGTNFSAIGSGTGASGINLLVNPGFESGVAQGWTNTGGTFASVSGGSNLLVEKKSATFTASAGSQSFQSSLYTVPNGLVGRACIGSMLYKGGDSGLTFQVLDNSSNVLASQALQATTVATPVSLPFLCPSSGSVQLKVLSSASAAIVSVDQMFLGENALVQLSQAQLVGGAVVTGCAAAWNNNSTSFASLGTQTGCSYAVFGSAIAPATNVAGIKFSSLAAGEYVLVYQGQAAASLSNVEADFQFTDGTNNAREVSQVVGGASSVGTTGISQSISYTTSQSNVTLQIFAKNASASASASILGTTANPGVFRVYRFPTQSEVAVRAETVNWLVDLTQDGANPGLSTSSVASYTDISDAGLTAHTNPGSVSVQVPCSSTNPSTGLTCSAGNPELGVVFNLPAVQTVRACASFSVAIGLASSTILDQTFDITETSNTSQTILQQTSNPVTVQEQPGAAINSTSRAMRVCGDLVFASAGQKTLRLKYRSTISGTAPSQNLVLGDGVDDRRVHWTVSPLTQNAPAPVFAGSVFSPSAGQERMVRALVDNSGVVTGSSGSWINGSCTVTGTSVRTCPFVAGTFSGSPVCVASIADSTASAEIGVDVTSSQVVVKTYNTGVGTAFAFPFSLICMGPK